MTKFMKHSGQSGSVRKIGKKMTLLLGVTLAALLSFSCKQDDALTDSNDNTSKTFDIVYELDGGTNVENPTKYSTDKLPVELKAPVKTGSIFEGWYKDKDFKNKVEKIKKGTTGKLTLYAKWSEIQSASYKVIHSCQRITGETYVDVVHDTETLNGKVGEETEAATKTYPGFHVSTVKHTGGKIIQEKIKADGTTVVKIHYDRDTFTAKFNTDGGNEIADISGRYEAEILPPAKPEKAGFTFIDWEPSLPAKFMTNTEHKAKWSAIPSVSYKVIHLWQPIEGDTYVAHETKTLSGKVGAETTAAAKTYPGFHLSTEQHKDGKILQREITADGETVVKIHYDRDIFTAKFNTDGGNAIPERSCRYETEILPPAKPTKAGYTFIGWEPSLPAKLMADTEYKATWTAEVLPEYKVQHWLQKLDGNGKACDASHKDNTCYELKDTDPKNGKKNTKTEAEAKTYTGFTSTGVEQENINENGSTVVKIYYVRKDVTLTFDAKGGKFGGEDNKTLSGKYGEKIKTTDVPNPSRNADEFGEWKPVKPTAFPEKDTTYEAQWKTLISIKIEQEPTKKDYIVGEGFDNKGLIVKAKYSDSSNPQLTYNVDYETDFDSINDTEGNNKTVTVKHKKDPSKTATFTVNIKPVPVITYEAGDIIDKSGKNKTKFDDFTLPAGANWEDYYVIIKVDGASYVGVRYFDNTGFGNVELGTKIDNTYKGQQNPPNRYLTKDDITAIFANIAKVKASLKKIKSTGVSSDAENFGKNNCIYKGKNFYGEDAFYNGNNAEITSHNDRDILPIVAKNFN